ncbi:hypothetical protein [Psychrobacillus soli]|uniref:Uncharacterized protein n=1 Tax=Psychrobacillus soli TaxID=1543965 RepID=A0A544T5L7_9BACI|nr:hypothetical protein [Psychrobacillus soli]TQR12719.1 hypothetical protein FG383_13305 [Psychrobacillus soli]
MGMKNNLKDITDFIKDIELKYNLFEHEIDGIYFWKILRFQVYTILTKKLGLYGDPHPSNNISNLKKIIEVTKKEIDIYKYNALRSKEKKGILVFQSPRKGNYNGKKTDIYTYFLRDAFNELDFYDYEFLEVGTNNKEYYDSNSTKIALNSLYKMKVSSFFVKIRFGEQDKQLIERIKREIYESFNLEIDILLMTKKNIHNFKQTYKYYCKLFDSWKPKKIILICSYGQEPLIAAAQDKEITVIELQHGIMTNYHLGYSFPVKKKIPYFPDKILIFGKYWKDSTAIPLKEKNINIMGYPYLSTQLDKLKDTKKSQKTIAFISQGTIAKELIHIAYEFARDNIDYKVKYKLHPSEYKLWREIYPELIQADGLENFTIIDNNKRNLYQILAESEFQVGVYSTAIYEGIVLNCKTVLINFSGIEEMEFLIEKGVVMLAKNVEELEDCIKNFKTISYSTSDFFADNVNRIEIITPLLN